MEQKRKRRFGDRKDGYRLRKLDAMHKFMPYLLVNRADNEAVLKETIDFTNAVKYLEEKNANVKEGEYKHTLFHVVLAALTKTMYHRPYMNRFIQGRRVYQRYDISYSFTVKKKFTDKSDEALAIVKVGKEGTSPFEEIYEEVKKRVFDIRVHNKQDGTTDIISKLVKLPRFMLRFVCSILKVMDFMGWTPMSLMKDDPYYSSVFISNLGSIKLSADYHHLVNYGTNSFFVIIGEKKKRPFFNDDGTYEMKDSIDIAMTVDERIADGVYFARTFALFKHLIANPYLLDRPVEEEVDIGNPCGSPQDLAKYIEEIEKKKAEEAEKTLEAEGSKEEKNN